LKVKPGDIIIKNKSILAGLMLYAFDENLIIIICQVAQKFGFRMSESYRPMRHKNDVHGLMRAIDLTEWVYTKDQAQAIETWINKNWIYDPGRPWLKVARLHKVKGGVLHFHIQVHPNTIKRGENDKGPIDK